MTAVPPAGRRLVGRDQVDRVVIFEQRDVRMIAHALLFERDLHRVAGGVGGVDDAAMAVAAFARQVEAEFGGRVAS